MKFVRAYLAVFLALTVLLTAHSAAAMRAARDATGQLVLCTSSGPVSVYVDAEGQPTDAPHVCPECLIHVFSMVVPDQAQVYFDAGAAAFTPASTDLLAVGQVAISPSARGPPEPV